MLQTVRVIISVVSRKLQAWLVTRGNNTDCGNFEGVIWKILKFCRKGEIERKMNGGGG